MIFGKLHQNICFQITLFLFCFTRSAIGEQQNSLLFRTVQLQLNFFTITLNDRFVTMPSWVNNNLRPLGSRWEQHLLSRAVRLSASKVIVLNYESHELFLSLPKSCDSQKLRSSHTVISEVYSVASVVDFTYISSL